MTEVCIVETRYVFEEGDASFVVPRNQPSRFPWQTMVAPNDVIISMDRITQHDTYLGHLIAFIGDEIDCSCEPDINFLCEECTIRGILQDVRWFIDVLKA